MLCTVALFQLYAYSWKFLHPILAQFIVHVRSSGVVALQNVGNPSRWLAIEGGVTKAGNGDGCSEFYVKEIGKHLLCCNGDVYVCVCTSR